VRPDGHPFVRYFAPAAVSVRRKTGDIDDGTAAPGEKEGDDRQGAFHLAPGVDVVHVLGDEIAALEEARNELAEIGKKGLPPRRGGPVEVGQVSDGLEAHQDRHRRTREKGIGGDEIGSAERIEKDGGGGPGLPKVGVGPSLHAADDVPVEIPPGLAGQSHVVLPAGLLLPGHGYRRRARQPGDTGEKPVKGGFGRRRSGNQCRLRGVG
jgi:hypothetical protein